MRTPMPERRRMNSFAANPSTLMIPSGSVALFLLLALLALPTRADAQTYTISDIGTLGGIDTFGTDINEQGRIVGEADGSNTPTQFHGFVSDDGTLIDLGVLPGGDNSSATGINSRGQVAGFADASDSLSHAVIWDTRKGTIRDLGTLNGTASTAAGINESGIVVGGIFHLPNGDFTHAFISGRNGTGLRYLGTLGGNYSFAESVNAAGRVTGMSTTADEQNTHAFISAPNGGALRDLGTLGGGSSVGFSINNRGQVTGESQLAPDSAAVPLANTAHACPLPPSLLRLLPPPALHAFINAGASCASSPNLSQSIPISFIHAFVSAPHGGPLMDLGTLGGDFSAGMGINNRGQVVGASTTANCCDDHAFLYSNGQMIDLNTVITGPAASHVELVYAQAINDRGWILAVGSDDHSYLLIPDAPGR